MKQILHKLFFTLLILAGSFTYGYDRTHCELDHIYSNTDFLTSIGEIHQYPLSDIIGGYNIEYLDIEFNGQRQPNENNRYEIIQGVQEVENVSTHDNYKKIVSQDMLIKTSGKATVAILAEDLEGGYMVRFGFTLKDDAPYFSEKQIRIPYDEFLLCYSLTLVNDETAVVDCVYDGGIEVPPKNGYYIAKNNDSGTKLEFQSLDNCYLEQTPLGRKTIKMTYTNEITGEQTYLIQGVPFDLETSDDENTQSYLNVLRYVKAGAEGHDNGFLQINDPITHDQLRFANKLQLADFQSLGDIMYILDHKQGVTFIKYWANKVIYLGTFLHSIILPTPRWGLNVNYAGAIVQMLIVETDRIVEYEMFHVDEGPQKTDITYQFDNTLIGTVNIQANAEYVVLEQGNFLTIYDRFNEDPNFVKAQMGNAEQFSLWYSNNLFRFHENTIYNYILQVPSLLINPVQAEEGIIQFKIEARSSNFQESVNCEIQMDSIVISPADSKEVYATGAHTQIEWGDAEQGFTRIPLDYLWVGPNLSYKVEVGQSEQQQQVGETEDVFDLHLNQPRIIEVIEEDPEATWLWTKIMPGLSLNDNDFITIRQNSQYEIYMHECKTQLLFPNKVVCSSQVGKIDYKSPVQSISFGQWGTELQIIAITKPNIPLVDFYQKSGKLWFTYNIDETEWGTGNSIIKINLHSNLLYIIFQNTERKVGILEYIENVQPRALITKDDIINWEHLPADSSSTEGVWFPMNVIVNDAKPNVIFIQTNLEIFVVSVEYQLPMYLDFVPIELKATTNIFSTGNSLIVSSSKDGNNFEITDYPLENLNYLREHIEFRYQTYDYQFAAPFTVAVGPQTGLIYMLAYQKTDLKTLKLLVYRSGVTNIRTLYKVIDLDTDCESIQAGTAHIGAGGQLKQDYVFIQYNDKTKYVIATFEPSLNIISLTTGKNYVDRVDFQIDIIPWATNGEMKTAKQEVSIVNTQTQVITNDDQINLTLPKTIYGNEKDSNSFDQDVSLWYDGSVLDMSISCSPNQEVCGTNITLKNIVHDNDQLDQDAYTNVVDIVEVSNNIYILRANSKDPDETVYNIEILGNDLDTSKTKSYAQFNVGKSLDGQDINDAFMMTPAFNAKTNDIFEFMIVLGSDDNDNWFYMKIYNHNDPEYGTNFHDDPSPIYLEDIKDIEKQQYQYFEGQLFLNQIKGDGSPGIYIFDLFRTIQIDDPEYQLCPHESVINKTSFNGRANDLYITSFYVTVENFDNVSSPKYVKVFITDSNPSTQFPPKLWFIDLDIANGYSVYSNSITDLDMREFILKKNLFINEDTHLLKIKTLGTGEELFNTATNQGILVFSALLLTSNTAIYEMELVFTSDTKKVNNPWGFDSKDCTIMNIYNNYGPAKPKSQIQNYSNSFSIAYEVDQQQGNVQIVVYEIQAMRNSSLKRSLEAANPNNIYTNLKTGVQRGFPTLNLDINPTLNTFQGGYEITSGIDALFGLEAPLAFILYGNSEYGTAILSQDLGLDRKLIAKNYSPNYIQLETQGKDFPEQKVTIKLNSAYNTQRSTVSRTVTPGKYIPPIPVNPNGGGGLGGGWIALIVILCLAVVGVAGFFVWKKYFANKDSSMIGRANKNGDDSLSESGFSLQAPLKQ